LAAILNEHRALRTCACNPCKFDLYGHHLSGCTKALRAGAGHRHTRGVALLNSYCQTAGLRTQVEKTGFFRGNCKSDIVFQNPASNRTTHVDLVVTCACNDSNLAECRIRKFRPGCIADMWERAKLKKYRTNALPGWHPTTQGLERNFYAAAIETHGRFGESIKDLLSMLAMRTAQRRDQNRCTDSRGIIQLRMIRELSFSVALDTVRGIHAHAQWAARELGLDKQGGNGRGLQQSHLVAPVMDTEV